VSMSASDGRGAASIDDKMLFAQCNAIKWFFVKVKKFCALDFLNVQYLLVCFCVASLAEAMQTRNDLFSSDSNIHIAVVCSRVDARSRLVLCFENGILDIILPTNMNIYSFTG
jgi:hypothetical protein